MAIIRLQATAQKTSVLQVQ